MAKRKFNSTTSAEVVTALDTIFNAFDAIEAIARATVSGNQDYISMVNAINFISSDMVRFTDEFRTTLSGNASIQ